MRNLGIHNRSRGTGSRSGQEIEYFKKCFQGKKILRTGRYSRNTGRTTGL